MSSTQKIIFSTLILIGIIGGIYAFKAEPTCVDQAIEKYKTDESAAKLLCANKDLVNQQKE